jgi:hypothetical protein
MPEKADFSPDKQALPKRGFLERRAINRISRRALILLVLDGQLTGIDYDRGIEVSGRQSGLYTGLEITRRMPHEGEDAFRTTNIELNRNPRNAFQLLSLEVDLCDTDDIGQYLGIEEKHRQFSLADGESELSLDDIAYEMRLAVSAVRRHEEAQIQNVPIVFP